MKRSVYLSLGLLTLVVAWMLSGAIAKAPERADLAKVGKPLSEEMRVKVLDLSAQRITREIIVQGALEPLRSVEIQAQIASRVVDLLVEKGVFVDEGEVIVQLAEEDRVAQLGRADADVETRRHELSAAKKLRTQGLQAESLLKAAESALAASVAELERVRLDLEYTRVRAPFAGVLEARYVEIGSHLDVGEPVAQVVDERRLKAVGRVSQQSAGSLRLGQSIKIRLLDGRQAEGNVTYISRLGDSETHSFRVEAEIDNAQGDLNAGVSAELRIAVGTQDAHFVSPSVFSLDDAGVIGVKSVSSEGIVQFHPIDFVRTEAEGVWVSGLPANVRVITLGQGFVNVGETVVPVPTI